MKIFTRILITILLLSPLVLSANIPPRDEGSVEARPGTTFKQVIVFDNPFKGADNLTELVEKIIDDILFPIGGVIAVLMIMYAGFTYVTAGGDMTKVKTATDTLLYTSIGAAILLGAKVIVKAISITISQL